MPHYKYQARNAAGKIVSGTIEGVNDSNAVSQLASKGLVVMTMEQAKGGAGSKTGAVTNEQLVMFTRMLATMVDAGIPLIQSLTALYEQSDPRKAAGLRRVLQDVISTVEKGSTMFEALSKHPKVFTKLYVSMVKAGEAAGLLAPILARLASYLEASERLRKKVKSAMTYPVVVIGLAIVITMFLIIKVVPVFANVFKDFGAKLPAPTQFLVDVSDFFRSPVGFISTPIVLGGIFFGIKFFLNTQSGRWWWDGYKFKLPVFGELVRKITLTRFARTFAQLIRSGVPILEVMQIVGASSGNVQVEASIKRVANTVERGDPLAVGLSKEPLFPPVLIRMIQAGEATGKVDAMLDKISDFWDEEIEATLNALTSLLEPIMIVILGVIIGGIVVALFLPIFKLSEVVSK
ncbi:type II secretion system F family protein [Oscillatoria laete-virens NRMC-F 0139]|nr:type II secretion system F family protein [Oscillatoria laete-virens]MDL5054713.1 type II secretion system F family protein [Oscillatoria laete-virens NRMC-F 0139]